LDKNKIQYIITAKTALKKEAVQCSADTFMVYQSFVLGINPDSYRDCENRHLRQARNRYMQGLATAKFELTT